MKQFEGRVAVVTGGAAGIGEPLSFDENLLSANPFLNETLWIYEADHWFALFKYYPLLLRFDQEFRPAGQVLLDHADFQKRFDAMTAERDDLGQPLFSDFKIRGNRLYLMSHGSLYINDPVSGKTHTRISFFGSGPEFGEVEGLPLALHYFCFLDNERVLLAHPALLWNHDLWTVTLPPHELARR